MDRFFVVDKPPGLTSHDVVAVIRAVTGFKKVGHTGTLDPFATGVLPIAVEGATKFIQYLDESVKIYDATVELGRATDTGDPTGTVSAEAPVPPLRRAEVERVLASFIGPRMQVPPKYSAVKLGGRPLYSYARQGVAVEVSARPIVIEGMDLLELEPPRLRVLIRCSRGTYARVIAEELGTALGTVGHLSALRRVRSGPFVEENVLSFRQLSEVVAGDSAWDRVLRAARGQDRVVWRGREEVRAGLDRWLIRPREVLRHLPAITLTAIEERRFRTSGALPARPLASGSATVLLSGEDVLGVVPPAR